ncbi:response regulator, partial [Mesorhizobium sp.]
MIVIVDERELVTEGYSSLFDREGVATAGFAPGEFGEWVNSAADTDLRSVRAFLIGDCREGAISPRQIRDRTGAPVIALSEQHSLEHTLRLFESGVDDVVRKPVHIREILARITAIRRRAREEAAYTEVGSMRIFMDGRDPEIDG